MTKGDADERTKTDRTERSVRVAGLRIDPCFRLVVVVLHRQAYYILRESPRNELSSMSRGIGARWKAAVASGTIILLGALVPMPFERRPEFGMLGPDKFAHFFGHGGFAVALVDALGAGRLDRRLAAVLGLVGAIAYGHAIEHIQDHVPGRGYEFGDIVAGTLGALVGIAGWLVLTDRGRAD